MNASPPEQDPFRPPKAEITAPARRTMRTPAQCAFDGCLLVFGILFVLQILVAGGPGLLAVLAVPGLFAWLWAVRGVVRTWSDADARVLRWSAIGLLIFSGLICLAMFSNLGVLLAS